MIDEEKDFTSHGEKILNENPYSVRLSLEGEWEFESIGFLRPLEDITPWESMTFSLMLASISAQLAVMHYTPALQTFYEQINNDARLKRHFKEN